MRVQYPGFYAAPILPPPLTYDTSWTPILPNNTPQQPINIIRMFEWSKMNTLPIINPTETSASWYGSFPERIIPKTRVIHTDPINALLTVKTIIPLYNWKPVYPDRVIASRTPNLLNYMQWFFMNPLPIPFVLLYPSFLPQPNPVGGTNPQAHGPKGWTILNRGASNANGGKTVLRMLQALGVSLYDQNGILRSLGVTGAKIVSVGVVTPKGEPQQNPPINPFAP